MQEISISRFFETEDASHTLRVIFQVPIDSTLVEDISIYFKDGNPLPKDVYQYIMDHINSLKWINPPQELFESDFSFPESRGVAAISGDLIFEHNDFDDNHFFFSLRENF